MSATAAERAVRIVEVGPRDGLQNEEAVVPADAKVAFIEALADTGLQVVEATSFVSPRAIPQLADADEVLPRVRRRPGVRYPVLVPNMRGLERAEAAGADAVAVFTAASEAFTQANIGMTIEGSLAAFKPVLERAGSAGWWRRGYVSTAFGCPYSGDVATEQVVRVSVALLELGCDEISIGDTIGVAHPDGRASGRLRAVGADRRGAAGAPFPRHVRTRARGCRGRTRARRSDVRLVGGRHRGLPVRTGRARQPRHRGVVRTPGRAGLRTRGRRSGCRARREFGPSFMELSFVSLLSGAGEGTQWSTN